MSHGALPPGVVQGPNGKFMSADEAASHYEDLEFITGSFQLLSDSGDRTIDGQTEGAYEGVTLLDIDDIVDRHEVADLLYVDLVHGIETQGQTSGEEQSGLSKQAISASPSRSAVVDSGVTSFDDIDDFEETSDTFTNLQYDIVDTDDADHPVRPYMAAWSNHWEDGSNGTGASANRTFGRVTGPVPGEWDFDRRDELYVNGSLQLHGGNNLTFKVDTFYQMAFGIRED